ncbi:MAG TPA: hypothetical protein DEP84_33925 [Chloroflexi bacterium]|nr:hypothetical protein [Chloroflexota bacterium]
MGRITIQHLTIWLLLVLAACQGGSSATPTATGTREATAGQTPAAVGTAPVPTTEPLPLPEELNLLPEPHEGQAYQDWVSKEETNGNSHGHV